MVPPVFSFPFFFGGSDFFLAPRQGGCFSEANPQVVMSPEESKRQMRASSLNPHEEFRFRRSG
jgi:hypothetical protein